MYKSVDCSKTSIWRFKVKRLDRQVRLDRLTLVTSGSSTCSGPWRECKVFASHPQTNRRSHPGNGTWATFRPCYSGKWGQVQGFDNFQGARVSARWCRGSRCNTTEGPEILVGTTM
jgi:hypothetical protein